MESGKMKKLKNRQKVIKVLQNQSWEFNTQKERKKKKKESQKKKIGKMKAKKSTKEIIEENFTEPEFPEGGWEVAKHIFMHSKN